MISKKSSQVREDFVDDRQWFMIWHDKMNGFWSKSNIEDQGSEEKAKY